MSPIAVLGGYGTFGRIVSRELAARGLAVVVAGRDGRRAEALARELGPGHRGTAADAGDSASCLGLLTGCLAVVDCAGPFSGRNASAVESALAASCHYLDIAEDRPYNALVRSLARCFRDRGLTAVHGAASLPGISGALAAVAAEGAALPADRARVVLFIGNANPKGPASLRALLGQARRSIRAPQGRLEALACGERIRLPAPFGRRRVCNLDSPEYDLFPALLGVRAVTVQVGFELPLAARLLAMLGAVVSPGTAAAGRLGQLIRPLGRFGGSGGAVLVELTWGQGRVRRAALVAERDGQRMAALPAVLAALSLARAAPAAGGAHTAYELLGPRALLAGLAASGYRLDVPGPP